MPKVAIDTAYYLNTRLPILALVSKGVRFPSGQWIRVASGNVMPWHVEELVLDLFPALLRKPVAFHVLLTEFDVQEFERELLESGEGALP